MRIYLILFFTLGVFTTFGQKTKSSTIIDSLQSSYLKENRLFFVYKPQNFDKEKAYPILYCTDGQKMIEYNYCKIFDSLISAKSIDPMIVIGCYSNEKEIGKNVSQRQVEYIRNFSANQSDLERFDAHKLFFTKEIPEFVLNKYDIKEDTTSTIFFGVSNGAGFGLTMYLEKEKNYTKYICLSPLGNIPVKRKKSKNDNYSDLYVGYGSLELFLLVDKYEKLIKDLTKYKYVFIDHKYEGKHNDESWKKELIIALTR
jgi:enterochelin esterase-like enzyme